MLNNQYLEIHKIIEDEHGYGYGAEVLRVWCAMNDEDQPLDMINEDLLHIQKEIKVIRQIIRSILALLNDYKQDPSKLFLLLLQIGIDQTIDTDQLSHFDNWMILKTHELTREVGQAYENLGLDNIFINLYRLPNRF